MATQANITIDQGATFTTIVNLTESDDSAKDISSNYSVAGKIKKSYSSASSVAFTTSITDGANGKITLSLTAAVTGPMKAGRYVYDVELTHTDGTVTRVLEGQAHVTPSVT